MHLDDGVPLGLGHVGEHAVTQDAGVVDDGIEPTEVLDGGVDEALSAFPVGDVVAVDDRFAAHALDLFDDLVSRRLITAGSIDRCPEVVDDHLGAVLGEHQGIFATDSSACSGDDDDTIVAQSIHEVSSFTLGG